MHKVSVIIPTYKRKKEMVNRAVESVLNQTYNNIEIILIDDNAKPEHQSYREEIENYVKEKNNDKIIYIQNKENLGGALARNVGIEKATGDYITFLDDDDKYLPLKIEKQINFMLQNNLDVCFSNIYFCNTKNEIVAVNEYQNIQRFDNEYLMRYHLTRKIVGTPSFMYKTDIIKRIGGFIDKESGQEYYLMYNTIKSGVKIGYLNSFDTVAYRAGQECITSRKKEQKSYSFIKEHFHLLTFWDKCYVRFSFYLNRALWFKKEGRSLGYIKYMIISFLSSPFDFFNGIIRRIKKKKYFKTIRLEE